MKKSSLIAVCLVIMSNCFAQITITKNDFAVAGDTFRVSTAAGIGINNVDSTGANMTWDYSGLTAITQRVDTFVAVSATPFLYQFYFNNQFTYPNTKATVATKIPTPTLPQGAPITLSNTYGFYKVNTQAFAQVGFGATISGLPTSIPYDSLDYVYRFPMNYGNSDSCKYKFQLSIPNIGYLRRRATRVNEVDGWGTLITPYGTFPTLRVKSTTYATDTIYITQLMFGTQIVQAPSVEYKWIGTTSGIPYLTVNATDGPNPTISSIVYRDSVRQVINLGMKEENPIQESTIYPNPANDYCTLSFSLKHAGNISIELFDAKGASVRKVMNAFLPDGMTRLPLTIKDIKPGLYFAKISTENYQSQLKFNKF